MRPEQKVLIEAIINLEDTDIYQLATAVIIMEVIENRTAKQWSMEELEPLLGFFKLCLDNGLEQELRALMKSYEVHDNH